MATMTLQQMFRANWPDITTEKQRLMLRRKHRWQLTRANNMADDSSAFIHEQALEVIDAVSFKD